jgi:septal ring factor EnvC (AmiA/AmiB activator)
MKIDERFINESINIRKEYLNLLHELKTKETNLLSIKNEIKETYKNTNNPDIDIDFMDDSIQNLKEKVSIISEQINVIVSNITDLKNKADKLYETIIYHNETITKDDLLNILKPHMDKIDKEFIDKYGEDSI